GDPVDGKLVESFARPGGNFTGMPYLALDLVGKRIELMKEWVPHMRRIAIFARPQHPGEHRRARVRSQAALGFGFGSFRRAGAAVHLWTERARALSLARALCRPHSEGRATGRAAGRGAEQDRTGDQS